MKSSLLIRKELARYKKNELIFASKLYREALSETLTEAAYYKMLERMCKKGELAKAAKGIYYVPDVSQYGIVPISEKQIIEAFTEDNTGMVIGYMMYNRLNLTTQIPKTVDIMSSALEGGHKTIDHVKVRRVEMDFTVEISDMICVLEVLQNFDEIEDLNHAAFIDYAEHIAQTYENEVFDRVISRISYKKSTISFLREVLNYFEVPNHLERYLSSLSTYKHPRMEEVYEAARISGNV